MMGSIQSGTESNLTLDCVKQMPNFLHVPRDIHFDNFLLAMIVINAVIAAVASCSNAVVIYTISRTPSLQTPSNILILGLAISDFGIGVLAQPLYCLFKFSEFSRSLYLYCSTGKAYIHSVGSLVAISFLTLTAITADRFLAVHLHLRYQDIITTKRVGIALGFIWFFGACFAVCTGVFPHSQVIVTLSSLAFCILLLLNVYFIVRVSLVIRRHSLQIQSQQSAQQPMNMVRFRKSVTVMFLVIGAFILCYVPSVVHGTIWDFVDNLSYEFRTVLMISQTLVMMNGVLNPIIYCWRIEDIRTAAVQLLRKMWRSSEN